MSRLSFHTSPIMAIIILCHCLFITEALADNAETLMPVRLIPNFRLGDEAMTNARRAIKEVLPFLARNDIIARELGFDDVTQIGTAKVGEVLPFLVFEVYLSDLQHFPLNPSLGLDQRLLRFTNQVLLPITVEKNVKASLTLRLFGGTSWQVKKWGSKTLIRELATTREALHLDQPSFLVQVPALNRDYLGYLDHQGVMQLVTLFKDQYFNVGVRKRAIEVFTQLAVEARAVDDSPR